MTFRVPGYRIEERIAQGDHAEVWKATHGILGTSHAIKRLRANADLALYEALRREAKVHALVRHRNVVRLTDALRADGRLVLVLDLVDGLSLADFLDEHGRPHLRDAITVMRGVTKGLRQVHRLGIVHRDVKPENIMLEVIGGIARPVLIDFGLAKHLAPQLEQEDGTVSGIFRLIGTPEYMAPEQAHEASAVDQRADLFSLGCVLYELLTGKVAFDSEQTSEALEAIRDQVYVAPEEWVPSLPVHLTDVVKRLLSEAPGERPQCDELLGVLRASLD